MTAGGASTLTLKTAATHPGRQLPGDGHRHGASATHTTTVTLVVTTRRRRRAPVQSSPTAASRPAWPTPWTLSAGVLNNSTSEPAHAGSWDAWLDGYGSTHTDTATQSVTIPAGKSTATLPFYLHIDTAETTTTTQYDKFTVKLGSTTVATFSNLNKAAGYVGHTYNLGGLAGSVGHAELHRHRGLVTCRRRSSWTTSRRAS